MELNYRRSKQPRHSHTTYPGATQNKKSFKIAKKTAITERSTFKNTVILIGCLIALCFIVHRKESFDPRRKLFSKQGARNFPRVIYLVTYDFRRRPLRRDPRVRFFPERSNDPRIGNEKKWQVSPMITAEKTIELRDSKDYNHEAADRFETETCKAQYSWQTQYKPTCHTIHELDQTEISAGKRAQQIFLVDNGFWRDVWHVAGSRFGPPVALKTLRYVHDTNSRNFDRNRRDAVAMERLTASPWVLNVHGNCANAGIYEFASGGTITDQIWPKDENGSRIHQDIHSIPLNFLRLSIQATMGLAATHNSDKEGVAAIAHTDITPSQFVISKGQVKLNDFNRARFLRWNVKKNRTCTYRVGNNPGTNRSPEEYAYKLQSEKVDVYSLGNVFYMLVSRMWPFGRRTDQEAQTAIMHGVRPPIPNKILNSTNPVHKILFKAMDMCYVSNPSKRATAREVEQFLIKSAMEYYPKQVNKWVVGK